MVPCRDKVRAAMPEWLENTIVSIAFTDESKGKLEQKTSVLDVFTMLID